MKTNLILLSLCLAVTVQGAGGVVPPVTTNALANKTYHLPRIMGGTNVANNGGTAPTNWVYWTQDASGRLNLAHAWGLGFGAGRNFIQIRNDAIPNTICYVGNNAASSEGGFNAVYATMDGPVELNTDPRFRIRQGAADDHHWDIKYQDIVLESTTGALLPESKWHVIRISPTGEYRFASNNWPTEIHGTIISAESNVVAEASLSTSPVSVTLTADNQTVSTTNRSHIRISSDNATAANRTFVLTPIGATLSGQILVIEWVGTNAGEIADDSANTGGGNNRLSAIWTPTQYDTLNLQFNGTDWVEKGRATN